MGGERWVGVWGGEEGEGGCGSRTRCLFSLTLWDTYLRTRKYLFKSLSLSTSTCVFVCIPAPFG